MKRLRLGPKWLAAPFGSAAATVSARGQQPALAPVADCPWLDDEILNDEVFIALEAGAFRQAVRLDDPGLVNGERRPLCAAVPLPPAAFGASGLRRLLHAAGLKFRAFLQTLEPCDLLAKLSVLCLQPGNFLQSLHQQRLQLIEAKPGKIAGRFGHAQRESLNESTMSRRDRHGPEFCPCY